MGRSELRPENSQLWVMNSPCRSQIRVAPCISSRNCRVCGSGPGRPRSTQALVTASRSASTRAGSTRKAKWRMRAGESSGRVGRACNSPRMRARNGCCSKAAAPRTASVMLPPKLRDWCARRSTLVLCPSFYMARNSAQEECDQEAVVKGRRRGGVPRKRLPRPAAAGGGALDLPRQMGPLNRMSGLPCVGAPHRSCRHARPHAGRAAARQRSLPAERVQSRRGPDHAARGFRRLRDPGAVQPSGIRRHGAMVPGRHDHDWRHVQSEFEISGLVALRRDFRPAAQPADVFRAGRQPVAVTRLFLAGAGARVWRLRFFGVGLEPVRAEFRLRRLVACRAGIAGLHRRAERHALRLFPRHAPPRDPDRGPDARL